MTGLPATTSLGDGTQISRFTVGEGLEGSVRANAVVGFETVSILLLGEKCLQTGKPEQIKGFVAERLNRIRTLYS